MKIEVKNVKGESVGEVDLRGDVFDAPMNAGLVHQVIVGQLANARQGTAKTKTRGEVTGGGRKPRPQKHTGQSRQGSIRSPLWKGGGVTFGPSPRSYRQRTPRKMVLAALRMTLSDKARGGGLIVLSDLNLESAKTREFASMIAALDVGASTLLVGDGASQETLRAGKNVRGVDMLPASTLSARDVMNHSTLIMTVDAVRMAESLWGGAEPEAAAEAA